MKVLEDVKQIFKLGKDMQKNKKKYVSCGGKGAYTGGNFFCFIWKESVNGTLYISYDKFVFYLECRSSFVHN